VAIEPPPDKSFRGRLAHRPGLIADVGVGIGVGFDCKEKIA